MAMFVINCVFLLLQPYLTIFKDSLLQLFQLLPIPPPLPSFTQKRNKRKKGSPFVLMYQFISSDTCKNQISAVASNSFAINNHYVRFFEGSILRILNMSLYSMLFPPACSPKILPNFIFFFKEFKYFVSQRVKLIFTRIDMLRHELILFCREVSL